MTDNRVSLDEVCCPECGVGGFDIVQTLPADEDGLAEFRCAECGGYFTEFIFVPSEEPETQPQRWVERGGVQVPMASRERMVDYGGAWLTILAGSMFGFRQAWYKIVGHGVETRLVLKDGGDDSSLAGNSQVLNFDGMSPGKAWDAMCEKNSYGSGHAYDGCHACTWSIWAYAGRPPAHLLSDPDQDRSPGRVAFTSQGLFDPEASIEGVTADDVRAAIDWQRKRLATRINALTGQIMALNEELISAMARRENLDQDYDRADALTDPGHVLRTSRVMALMPIGHANNSAP